MVSNKLLSNFISLFNSELLYRLIAVIIFVPTVIISLYQGGLLLFVLFLFLFIFIFSEIISIYDTAESKINVFFYSLITLFSLSVFPYYFFSIENNFIFSLYIIFSIWIFDTFSYIGGKIFRGKKIFPKISKGKTYSGLISGVLSVYLVSILVSWFGYSMYTINFFTLSTIIFSLSFIGDFLVSILKRQSNLKDTGYLFIGHGGFLDRMDSFILVFFIVILFDLHHLMTYA